MYYIICVYNMPLSFHVFVVNCLQYWLSKNEILSSLFMIVTLE